MLTTFEIIFCSNKLELLRNTFTQLVLLIFLTVTSNQILADELFNFPPVVTITNPTTSNNIYVTENGTLNIAGSASDLSYIDRVEWILFDLNVWEEIDSGEAVIENNLPFSATWYANNINLPYGMSDITVIAFDIHGNSNYDRLVITRSEESLEELFDEEIAQADPSDSCGRQTGDPIDTATGAQFLRHTLLTVKGLVPISFALEYNSLLTKDGTTGRGWGNSNSSTSLEELDNGDVKIHWTTNRYNIFTKQNNEQYESFHSACRFDRLVKNPDGHFILSRNNKITYEFNTQGQLINRSNQNGQSLIFSYDGNGQLAMVEEPVSGVFLDYAYNSEGLLATITDPLGRQAKLEYDNNHHLTKMIDAVGQTITYTYNNLGQTLTAVNSGGVQLFSNIYDDNHRIISQDDSVGNQIHLSYDTDITTVTNRIGDIKIYTFDNDNQLLSLKNELDYIETYTYDINGKRTSVTDANGNTTEFEYDTNGNLKTLLDAKHRKTQLIYSDDNHLLSVENALGKQIKFAYENNLLTSVTDPFNQATHYTYNDAGQVLTKTSPLQAITTYEYNNAQLVRIINPENVVYTLGYDTVGRLITLTDVDDNQTTLIYDDIDRLIKVTNSLGHTVSMTYDSRDNLLNLIDANGNVTKRDYNANGKLISQTNALNEVTRYEYDGEERLIRVIDALEQVTELGYDVTGRLIQITNPLGYVQTLEYDAANNLLKRFDALGKRMVSFNYDELNNLTEVTDALNQGSQFEYDELNRLISTIDPLNRKTQFGYDDLNRLMSSVDALQGESKQDFDAEGHKNHQVDANGNATQFTFNKTGRLIQETIATNDKVSYSYNAKDLLVQVTNGRGQKRQFEYDELGRITRWTDPDGSVYYTYDNNGNILTVTDASGVIAREYDKLNRIIKYTDISGNILQYTYDLVGNLVGLTYPDGKLVSYEYDAVGQLIKVTDWMDRVTTYAYDKNGRLISTLRPNGTLMNRVYDDAGQLKQQKDIVVATSEVINQFNFEYDAVGNIVKEATFPEADPEINLEMTYQAANRLATVDSDVVDFDADGNMLSGGLNQFDSRNRLIQSDSVVYSFDAENQRIGVNQTQYVVNSQPALSQVLVKEENGQKTFYVYGLGLIGQEVDGEYTSYHFDYRGSTVALSDSSGQITEQFQYSPYGLLLSGDSSKTPFLFNGMYGVMTDSNGLYYMRARFYNPEIKRFINQDILLGSIGEGQTLNRYAFVTGRPVSFVDPFGLFARSPSRRVRRGLYRDLTGEGVLELLEWEKAGPPPFPYPIVPLIDPIEIPYTTRRNKDNIWKDYYGFPLECRENQRDKCTAILMEMYAVIYIRRTLSGSNTQGLQNRYLTQLADPSNFYYDDPKKWDTHNNMIDNAINKLKKLIEKARKMGCTIPDEIIMWSQILPPSSPRR